MMRLVRVAEESAPTHLFYLKFDPEWGSGLMTGVDPVSDGFLEAHPDVGAYSNFTIHDVQLEDRARTTKVTPFSHSVSIHNKNFRISNAHVKLNRWMEPDFISLYRTGRNYRGAGTSVFINYDLWNSANQPMNFIGGREEEMSWYMSVNPTSVFTGKTSQLSWGTVDAGACVPKGEIRRS